MTDNGALPEFLQSFENLTAHFDEHFGELGSNDRGDTFLGLVERLIPLAEECQGFPKPEIREKKSHDGGVDLLTAETDDGRILCAQSKYKIRDKESLDSIVSKFKNFEETLLPFAEPDLFTEHGHAIVPVPTFLVLTSSKLQGILKRYESSTLASRTFFDILTSQRRCLIFIDGPRILTLLQQLYRKAHQLPANVDLHSVSGWASTNGVHLGAVRGGDLVKLYEQHGDALFFENIRDFLGTTSGRVVTTRSTVNQDIIRTISDEPIKMLPRNNGITFRARSVEHRRDQAVLQLHNAAIVNGCQTTMCLVHCDPVPADCVVQVKIVETEDAWDIAKAANYQNPVTRVDLDLARYLRPQLVRKMAISLGYAIDSDSEVTASSVLNTIYQNRVNYEELRLLYLGLFSRRPNNLFEGNYTELRPDILEELYEHQGGEEAIFSVLLLLLSESRKALDECRATFSGEEYATLFRRFYRDDRPKYRAYLAIGALCGLVREDLSERSPDTRQEVERARRFLGSARAALENGPSDFRNVFVMTFQTIAESLLDVPAGRSESEIAQQMSAKVSDMAFSSFYKRVLMRIDGEQRRLRKGNSQRGHTGS